MLTTATEPLLSRTPLRVNFRPFEVSGYATGVLDLELTEKRVLSVPTQLGCPVACTFCISSKASFVRNLRAQEILTMVEGCLSQWPRKQPVELSFTGEGEGLLNWRAVREVCRVAKMKFAQVQSVRVCFSGQGCEKLLPLLDTAGYPCRLQFSLHAARQQVRDTLVPCSSPLPSIERALLAHAHRFVSVELNVVLQEGVNDSDADLEALAAWGAPEWLVVLNPQLQESGTRQSPRSELFASTLRQRGRRVARYSQVGARIAEKGGYPLMRAKK